MPCDHMKKLYQLCSDSGLRLSSSDLIKIACKECGDVEVCPSVLLDEYESKKSSEDAKPDGQAANQHAALRNTR